MSHLPYDPMAMSARQTNGLAIAGFVCALVGLFTGGLLCLVGLILSLIALSRPPRGFAIAGVIISLLGMCFGLIILLFFSSIVLAALAAIGLAVVLSDAQRLEITTDMATIGAAIHQYQQEHRRLPASLDLLDMEGLVRVDPWGRPYEYHFSDNTETGFDLVSAGQDGTPGTDDDVMLSALDKLWSNALEEFKDKMREMESGEGTVEHRGGEADAPEDHQEPGPPASPPPPPAAGSSDPG